MRFPPWRPHLGNKEMVHYNIVSMNIWAYMISSEYYPINPFLRVQTSKSVLEADGVIE